VRAESIRYRSLDYFLRDAIEGLLPEGVFPPTLYFDTNVFLDIIDNRDRNSLDLYRYAYQHKWQCVTSVFAKVEVLEVKQIHQFKREKQQVNWSDKRIKTELHKRDLSTHMLGNISRSLTARLKSIYEGFKQYSCLVETGWVKVEEIKRKTNLTDKDSIHLAEALAIACDLFISRDDFLLEIAKRYIWAERPDSVIEILKSVGGQI